MKGFQDENIVLKLRGNQWLAIRHRVSFEQAKAFFRRGILNLPSFFIEYLIKARIQIFNIFRLLFWKPKMHSSFRWLRELHSSSNMRYGWRSGISVHISGGFKVGRLVSRFSSRTLRAPNFRGWTKKQLKFWALNFNVRTLKALSEDSKDNDAAKAVESWVLFV